MKSLKTFKISMMSLFFGVFILFPSCSKDTPNSPSPVVNEPKKPQSVSIIKIYYETSFWSCGISGLEIHIKNNADSTLFSCKFPSSFDFCTEAQKALSISQDWWSDLTVNDLPITLEIDSVYTAISLVTEKWYNYQTSRYSYTTYTINKDFTPKYWSENDQTVNVHFMGFTAPPIVKSVEEDFKFQIQWNY